MQNSKYPWNSHKNEVSKFNKDQNQNKTWQYCNLLLALNAQS